MPLDNLSDCMKIHGPGKRTRSSEDPLKFTYLTNGNELVIELSL